MTFPSRRQSTTSTQATQTALANTYALPAPAVAGNLLVVTLAGDKDTGTVVVVDDVSTDGAGWIVEVSVPGASVSTYLAHKVAVGGEQTITATTQNAPPVGTTGYMEEVQDDGAGAWTVLGKAVPAYDNTSRTSADSGAAGPMAYDARAIAVGTIDSLSSLTSDDGPTFTGFTRINVPARPAGTGGGNAGCYVGEANVAAGASTSTTFATNGGTDQLTCVIVAVGRAESATPAPPVVDAGADVTIALGATFTRTAAATNSPTSGGWTVDSGPAEVGATLSNGPTVTWTPTVAGVYVLRHTATNAGGSGTDTVTITVDAPAAAPTVSAGADAALTVPATFTRTAGESGSGITSRAWTIVSGPAGSGSTIGTAAALSWTPTAAGVYVLRYTATNAGGPGTDDVTVTVSLPPAPTVSAGADTPLILGAAFTRTATETGSSITARAWTIVSGPAGSGSTIGTAAALSWTPTVAGVYVLRYSATNPGGTGTDTVTITVDAPAGGGVPFLVDELGPNARIAVEIAWGADLTADPAGWVWTDVTRDMRHDPGISTSLGRADEAATTQPATLNVTLDNTLARYSLGGQSPNWPHVRRNVPVRAQIDLDGTGFAPLFIGYATGFTPSWNLRGTVAEVELEAAGTLRRLIQGASPLVSSIRRTMLDRPDVMAYWPVEDGKFAERIAGAVGDDMAFTGVPKFGDSDAFACSDPIPVINGASLSGSVPTYTATGENQVRALIDFPAGDEATNTVVLRVLTNGSAGWWDLIYETGSGGMVSATVYDRFGTVLADTPGQPFGINQFPTRRWSLEMTQIGADISWGFSTMSTAGGTTPFYVATLAGHTVGTVTAVIVNPGGGLKNAGVGHISVQNNVTSIFDDLKSLRANAGEYVAGGERMPRLCAENGVSLEIQGPAEVQNSPTDYVGAQRSATLVELLRDAEQIGQGVLYDGRSAGLTYSTKRDRENRPPDLTISAAAAMLASPFGPVDDDQRTRNRVEVKREGGSSAVFEDVDGPLGTAAVGVYDSSVTLNAYQDDALPLFAAWFVSQGTVEGYRYPALSVDLRAAPALASAILAARPGHRVDVTGLSEVLPGHPGGTLSLLVEGVQHRITSTTWRATLKCSPYVVWRLGVVAAETGDTGEYVARAEADGSTVGTPANAGATSLSVATAAGGSLWTTTADDYPLALDVGGFPVTATACTGTASPQTFTVAALPTAVPAGVPVALWNPTRLGL